MSQPQKWEGKGGYFYDYKPSKGTKGTPGYRPATITMHGGRYNNTAGTTIDEEHTHFDGIIAELKALGDDRGPFMSLTQYQQQQAAQGNRASTNDVVGAAAAELIGDGGPVERSLGPVGESNLTPMQAQALAAEPAPTSGLPRPLPEAGEDVDALRTVVPMDGGREPAPVATRRPLRGDPAGYPDASPPVPRPTGLSTFADNARDTELGRIAGTCSISTWTPPLVWAVLCLMILRLIETRMKRLSGTATRTRGTWLLKPPTRLSQTAKASRATNWRCPRFDEETSTKLSVWPN